MPVLLPTDSHLPDQQRRRRHGAPKFQVGARSLHVQQHLPQIRRDSDLRNRIRELAVLNPQASRTPRIIAGYDVDPLADQLRYIQPLPNSANDFLRRALAPLEKEIAVSHARVSRDAARRVAGGAQPQLASGVTIEQITSEHPTIDHYGAARRDAFIIERRGAE